ncbi:hypothetical protein DFH08DRAFT_357635 [Mycena albidolilacea]|uniref:BAH domain-containing protein n=1 Tax=Mycena albidolilacea TaxID=1033008 RepID=A0AAD6ZHZ4_9AGAR|nr:hypothetical protein DFH08DRAFT_357635 [Mycena albidolilacea]
MPKSRSRLTIKKKSKKGRVALGREKNAPTAEEWAGMPQYYTFQVEDEDGMGHDFSVNDLARILPHKREVGDVIETHEYWVCKIVDVRARSDTDVWVSIEWFYSPQDAIELNKEFDPSHCGKYERLKSNHTDCVSSHCFDGLAPAKQYDETNLDQESIGGEEFYYRYTANISDKSIFPTPSASCVCDCLYNPSDVAPNSVMHLCPQPGCRKYYHRGCIASMSTKNPPERIHFLLTDPDTGASIQLPLIESASAEPAKKRRRASSHASVPNTTIPSPAAFRPLLAALPPVLVRAAAQPMVRGGVLGVAGNTAAVVAARRTVCAALRDGTFAEGWEKRMPEGWEQTMPEGWDAEDVLLVGGTAVGENGVKPEPGVKFELGVSVSAGGGKRKGAKGKRKTEADPMAVLQCPECGGPV